MNLFIASLVIIAVGATILFATWKPDKARGIHRTFERSRKAIGAVFVILISWTLLRSGRPTYIGAALLMIVLATIYFVIERPDKQVV